MEWSESVWILGAAVKISEPGFRDEHGVRVRGLFCKPIHLSLSLSLLLELFKRIKMSFLYKFPNLTLQTRFLNRVLWSSSRGRSAPSLRPNQYLGNASERPWSRSIVTAHESGGRVASAGRVRLLRPPNCHCEYRVAKARKLDQS